MEKLNELEDLVLLVNSKNNPFDNYSAVNDKTILAIAKHIRALGRTAEVNMATAQALRDDMYHWKRRAEAAGAKLAELAKQKPVGTVSIAMDWNTHRNVATVNMRHDLVVSEMKDGDELFTRPAFAADLVPDGWKLVPVEPTEEMIIEGFESRPDESFSEPAVWKKYSQLIGCQQAAYKAQLCWAAMLAAAPEVE